VRAAVATKRLGQDTSEPGEQEAPMRCVILLRRLPTSCNFKTLFSEKLTPGCDRREEVSRRG
jgi:hypothetical protein